MPKRTAADKEAKATVDPLESNGARRVGLRPGKGWHKRNFLSEVLIPSMFTRRGGERRKPEFPELEPGQFCVTWIGHASFLVQTHRHNLLIDPNWARWLKVIKRIKQPGMHLHDLPSIDLVMVSHAHFDHLDRKTLREVAERQPIIVPMRVGNLVHDLGFNEVHELKWWESYEFDNLTVTMTPCHHWGARILHDQDRGYGGFHIQEGGRSIFHCGDTAYFDGFREIGEKLPIEIALMPIGAYDPPSAREVHMNPEEAVNAFIELDASKIVPMHYGSFRLSYEPVDEPLERLLAAAEENGIKDKLVVLEEGRPVVF